VSRRGGRTPSQQHGIDNDNDNDNDNESPIVFPTLHFSPFFLDIS